MDVPWMLTATSAEVTCSADGTGCGARGHRRGCQDRHHEGWGRGWGCYVDDLGWGWGWGNRHLLIDHSGGRRGFGSREHLLHCNTIVQGVKPGESWTLSEKLL